MAKIGDRRDQAEASMFRKKKEVEDRSGYYAFPASWSEVVEDKSCYNLYGYKRYSDGRKRHIIEAGNNNKLYLKKYNFTSVHFLVLKTKFSDYSDNYLQN